MMAPVPRSEWQNALRAAIERQYGSLNGYARHLAGPEATPKQVEAKRRPMMKWLQETKAVVPTASSVAKLRSDGIDFDPDLLPTRTAPHRHTTEELAGLMGDALKNQERMWAELERLADAVHHIETFLRPLAEGLSNQPRRRRSNG